MLLTTALNSAAMMPMLERAFRCESNKGSDVAIAAAWTPYALGSAARFPSARTIIGVMRRPTCAPL